MGVTRTLLLVSISTDTTDFDSETRKCSGLSPPRQHIIPKPTRQGKTTRRPPATLSAKRVDQEGSAAPIAQIVPHLTIGSILDLVGIGPFQVTQHFLKRVGAGIRSGLVQIKVIRSGENLNTDDVPAGVVCAHGLAALVT